MYNIKSTGAKSIVELTTQPFGECARLLSKDNALHAVALAEQDAEERHTQHLEQFKARVASLFCRATCQTNAICHDRCDEFLAFKQMVDKQP